MGEENNAVSVIKRRGRPPGSKNKPKIITNNIPLITEIKTGNAVANIIETREEKIDKFKKEEKSRKQQEKKEKDSIHEAFPEIANNDETKYQEVVLIKEDFSFVKINTKKYNKIRFMFYGNKYIEFDFKRWEIYSVDVYSSDRIAIAPLTLRSVRIRPETHSVTKFLGT